MMNLHPNVGMCLCGCLSNTAIFRNKTWGVTLYNMFDVSVMVFQVQLLRLNLNDGIIVQVSRYVLQSFQRYLPSNFLLTWLRTKT